MKKLQQISLAIAVMASSQVSIAGSAGGMVGRLYVQDPNVAFVTVGSINAGPGFCGSLAVNTTEFALNLNTATGKAQYATLLTAKALENNVTIVGKDNCDVWPDRESVNYIFMD